MNPLQQIGTFGQSVWLDFISRTAIADGTLRKYIDNGVVGMTSNPAIFEKALSGSEYDSEIAALAGKGFSNEQIFQQMAIEDVQAAADLLRPIFHKCHGNDGFVSLEVSPMLARDTEGTIREAQEFWNRLARPNVMVKIPATAEGLPAIEESIASGININVTLLFSVERYAAVAERYIRGLDRLKANGGDVTKIRSVASFFLSRIDTLVDPKLEGAHHELAGKTAIACAKHAYEAYHEIFSSTRFAHLAEAGAKPQRLLWASTSTKNPAYPDTMYVEPLIGPDTVNTMPTETIAAYIDHGKPASRLDDGMPEVHQTLRALEAAGINLGAVANQLEEEALKKFIDPFHKLLDGIAAKTGSKVGGKA
jgi:transaldolase/transaldolase/glucose-6-phosphate isomerase